MSPGMLGISDWGIMIHLFFLHLPTQKRCWSFFISLGRKAREGLDSIFQGEHARCIPHILLAASPASASLSAQPPRGQPSLQKTHIRATLSFLARLHSHKTALSLTLKMGHAPVNSQFSPLASKLGKDCRWLVLVVFRISVRLQFSLLAIVHNKIEFASSR